MIICLKAAGLYQVNGANNYIDGYHFSLQGRSHIESDTVCQDFSLRAIGERYSFAAVADGVGSARLSQIGSKTAVETVYNHCKSALGSNDKDLLLKLLSEGFVLALKAIEQIATTCDNTMSDYDTTLTVALFDGESVLFGHIGDGGLIAIDNTGQYSLLTTSTKGDSWNEVIPLRADSRYYHFEAVDGIFSGIALFTDGVFDTVAPPLLANSDDPIFHSFTKNFLSSEMFSNDINLDKHGDNVASFLQSDSCASLHDDLSVTVLINKSAKVASPPDEYFKEPDWNKLKEDIYYKLYPHLLPKEEVEDEGI